MGARHSVFLAIGAVFHISIHAPRMGARRISRGSYPCRWSFQSTRPAWGRDVEPPTRTARKEDFNPRAPHGGATKGGRRTAESVAFQSTRPAWGRDPLQSPPAATAANFNPRAPHGGATGDGDSLWHERSISIHAPRMGARRSRSRGTIQKKYFNPRAPHGGATSRTLQARRRPSFQSTRPAWGRDQVR